MGAILGNENILGTRLGVGKILFGLDFRMTGAQGGYSGFQVSEMTEGFFEIFYFGIFIVCYTAVFSVVTQRSSPGALRDDA